MQFYKINWASYLVIIFLLGRWVSSIDFLSLPPLMHVVVSDLIVDFSPYSSVSGILYKQGVMGA